MRDKLVFGITKIVSEREEQLGRINLVRLVFAEAYTELRRVVPRGDLRIHLSVEADSAEEVGAVFEPDCKSSGPKGENQCPCEMEGDC